MLNEKRIITMSQMALYSEGDKKRCMKICNFYRKDYIAFQTIMTILWATLGYIIVVCGLLFLGVEELTSSLTIDLIMELATMVIGGYLLVIFMFCVVAIFFYGYKYNKALSEAKKYYKALGLLNKEYKREK